MKFYCYWCTIFCLFHMLLRHVDTIENLVAFILFVSIPLAIGVWVQERFEALEADLKGEVDE